MSTPSRAERRPLPLPDLLALRAGETPGQVAYTYLTDGEEPGEATTYGELHVAVRARAAALGALRGEARGAVLAYPTGLEFIRSWLACASAGIAAAPLQVPTRRHAVRRLRGIADDIGTTLVLTTRAVRDRLLADFGGLPELEGLDLVATDELPPAAEGVVRHQAALPDVALPDVALLQYTSGSTGAPRGVMVTHANFWANAAETDALWPVRDDGVIVSWLPFFHDMGLMLGVVLPLWAARPAYLMGPEAFIRRPARWLEALSRFGGTHTAAPNFAYDLCLQGAGPQGPVDLSRWRVGINGAEPVRADTVAEFTGKFAPYGLGPDTLVPAYGLAENTLKVSGTPPGTGARALRLDAEELGLGRVVPATGEPDAAAGAASGVPVMSCGVPVGDTSVRIVDPRTLRAAADDEVGEIWVSGPCVAAGYAGREEESERTFRARIQGDPDSGSFLRTGDTGFVRDGEVYVTGRLKDLLIIKGRNHYPQDIEYTAESSHPLLRPASAAAFPVDTGRSEGLVLVVEADSRVLRYAGEAEVVAAVREAVRRDHRIDAHDVVLIRRGTLPKTTSGKVRRTACRESYETGTLHPLGAAPDRVGV
ncbi:fatty acyl-AMP ligase [Streptomyces sp. 150FB]|uniref:fatty acyl-AMP ligase n=1 Tax=Streptomyces sp. 150FB TaxID=1576605 RepID=UPI0006988168|nr:fatty acyl-AMP ligase [Streptomyces sp. 150FB]